LAELSDADSVRLRKYAGWRFRHIPFDKRQRRNAEDLLESAVDATLDGTRRWNKKNSFVEHLKGVMSSRASTWTRRVDADPATLASDLLAKGVPDRDLLAEQPSRQPSPENEIAAKDLLAHVESLLANDDEASLVFAGLREGRSLPEIAKILELDIRAAETIATRIRRKARAAFPEGKYL
jgi:DNA-directed RNA polymerase specialized sigma24 family protein